MALDWIEGFEHGVGTTAAEAGAGGGISRNITVGTSGSISVLAGSARSGGYGMRIVDGASASWWDSKNLVAFAETSGFFAVRFAVLPTSGTDSNFFVCANNDSADNRGAFTINPSGVMKAKAQLTGALTTGDTLVANTWYGFVWRYSQTGTAWFLDWQMVSPSRGPSYRATYAAAAGWYSSYLQCTTIGGTGMTVDYDDLIRFDTLAEYPKIPYQVSAISPNATGTHNLDASPSSFFFEHNGTSATALSTGETASASRVDDVPINASTDYMYATGAPGATQYGELQLADPQTSITPVAVRVIEALQQATAGGSTYTSKVTNDGGTSLTDVQTALDVSSATEVFRTKVLATRPSGGAWTDTDVRALRYRFGLTADATPEIQLRSLMVEVATEVPAGVSRQDLSRFPKQKLRRVA